MSEAFGIVASGMVTGVGLTAPASCAAIRCGINNFKETRFISQAGEWIIGSEVPFEEPCRGTKKLAKMAASALRECLDVAKPKPGVLLPLILCLAEDNRPGRLPGLGGPLLLDIERELGVKFHAQSSVIEQGRVGGAVALLRAQKLLEQQHPQVIVAAVDSYLSGATLAAFEERDRVLTAANSNGFIPGEAAAALLLAKAGGGAGVALTCRGLGFARENATIESDQPLRGDGMAEATKAALAAAGMTLGQVDHRISDVSGEQYRFKELALTLARVLRERKEAIGIWHPADCIGEAGAAALPVMLGVLHQAAQKRYLPGPVFLVQLSNDDDKRAALILSAQSVA